MYTLGNTNDTYRRDQKGKKIEREQKGNILERKKDIKGRE